VPHTLDAFQLSLLSRMTDLAAAMGDSAHRSSELKLMLAQLILGMKEPPTPARIVQPVVPAREREAHSTTVREIIRCLEETVEERIRFPELARRFRMSTATLRRIFKAEVGMSPRAYRQQQVMTRAKLLLHRGNLSVTEVARRLGFCSIHYFSHAFTRATRMSPRAYARSLQPTVRQIEQARVLLEAGGTTPAEIASRMGFSSVHSFAQTFKQHVGISPKKYPEAEAPPPGKSAPRGR
jgi:AraC-like DNA-binding protein